MTHSFVEHKKRHFEDCAGHSFTCNYKKRELTFKMFNKGHKSTIKRHHVIHLYFKSSEAIQQICVRNRPKLKTFTNNLQLQGDFNLRRELYDSVRLLHEPFNNKSTCLVIMIKNWKLLKKIFYF